MKDYFVLIQIHYQKKAGLNCLKALLRKIALVKIKLIYFLPYLKEELMSVQRGGKTSQVTRLIVTMILSRGFVISPR